MLNFVGRFLVKASFVYLVYVIGLVFFHPWFIYPFSEVPFRKAGYEHEVIGTPDDPVHIAFRLGHEDAPTVLFFMGNVGSLAHFSPVLDLHEAEGRTIIALQFPGGAGIPGQPSEPLLRRHAAVMTQWAIEQEHTRLVVHGYSMGTSLALSVAAEHPVDAVVLDAPFARMCEVMAQRSWTPACLMPFVQKWDSLSYASTVDMPILVQHGTNDALIPITQSKKLRAGTYRDGQYVTHIEIDNATHTDLHQHIAYRIALNGFLGDF